MRKLQRQPGEDSPAEAFRKNPSPESYHTDTQMVPVKDSFFRALRWHARKGGLQDAVLAMHRLSQRALLRPICFADLRQQSKGSRQCNTPASSHITYPSPKRTDCQALSSHVKDIFKHWSLFLKKTSSVRCLPVAEVGNEDVDDVGHPGGEHGWEAGLDGKSGRDGLQEDIGEAQCQTDAESHAHAALALAC